MPIYTCFHLIESYSSQLEEATNFCIELDYDQEEEEFLFYLVDPCGDRDGDPWTSFEDLVFDTEDALQVAWSLITST